MEEERKVNVEKLGEFKLNDFSVLVINKTDYSGEDKVDFRVWKNSPGYKGPTKQGFVLSMDKMEEFIDMVKGMEKRLGGSGKTKKSKKK